jgi:ankyrin repeat protein
MMAAERCHLGIGRELIAGGADLNIQCHNGDTALMRAATCCRVEFVSLLIGAGAGIDIQNSKGLSALWKTFITNRSAFSSTMIVRKLLSAGADPDLQYDGDTPLMYTAAYGYESIARELIAGGADINIKDAEGWTALRLAVANDQRTIVALLLMEGAHDDDDEAFNLAVRLNRPYGNRGAWDDLRWRWTFSKLKTALSSAKAASKAPYLVATPTTPLQNFFHRRESLNVLEKIVSFLRSTTNEPLDRRFIDTPSASETHEEAQEEDESLWWD